MKYYIRRRSLPGDNITFMRTNFEYIWYQKNDEWQEREYVGDSKESIKNLIRFMYRPLLAVDIKDDFLFEGAL